ncbi:MAG: threonine ammonia-lyase [Oscillospiraceae bacterium]|nr:threonine ammonia-lyase [Oscillospiraceae bacterium]
MSGAQIYLKYENQQKTGSFKIRGAFNKLACLTERGEIPDTVVASSAGNHAQGVAFAASLLGVRARIVMPKNAPIAKISATEGYGAQVLLHGGGYDDAYQKALEIADESGAVFIHAFDDADVIAGQGTAGLEILKDIPAVDTVIVPAGGGGLLAGVSCCIKEINPRVKIIGVQAEGADAVARSFGSRGVASTERADTIADGIAVKSPGALPLSLINRYADDVVTVSDGEIAEAILLLIERTKQVVEPAGAASVAAAVSGKLDLTGKKAVCVISGGNIDVSFIQKIVERGLISRGRQIKLLAVVADAPGSLEKFAQVTGRLGANILSVTQSRHSAGLQLGEAMLQADLEVSGFEHGRQVTDALREAGYTMV